MIIAVVNLLYMIRKLTLLFLMVIGFQSMTNAQVRDSITITIPPYTDTTCVGTQLTFRAHQSNDTFTGVTYRWYANDVFTGVVIDTFLTTALNDGDSVYCKLFFTNSFGIADSTQSNTIIIHHAAVIPANVLISLVVGNNPDCAGHPLTFEAYPINGGTNPQYQWMINGVAVPGEDSTRFTRVFGGSDTVSCLMVSNSSCAPVDSVYSGMIPIIHIHLVQSISISTFRTAICAGGLDTFTAISSGYGSGANYQWYINGSPVTGAIGSVFLTTALQDLDTVYCVLTSVDSCVLNQVDTSNSIYMTVFHVYGNTAFVDLTAGTNPGCLTDPVTFTAIFDTFGTAPNYNWYLNGVLYAPNVTSITGTFNNTDIISFSINTTDGGCYTHDTINVPGIVMIRDTTPVAALVSLINDSLITYSSGTFTWYYSATGISGPFNIIPGATDSTCHPIGIGYYYCIVNNVNCPSVPSNTIFVSLLKVDDINKTNVKLYPNPANGTLNIEWGNASVQMNLSIYNALGQKVIKETISNASHFNADVSALPNGNYFVELKDDAGNFNTYKIVVSHN